MRNPCTVKWMIATVVAAGLAIAGTKAANANGEQSWRVSDIKGSVLVSNDGRNWTRLNRGDTVEPGTTVKTGSNGRTIMVRPGDSLDVAPGSYFNIPTKAPAGSGNPATHIMQKMGTILFKITTRPDNPFTVKTPYLAAVIKGTTFTVSVDRNDAALHVSKGAVQVSSILGGQTALVRPGQTAAIGASDGGRMRLIGIKNQTAPASQGNSADKKGTVEGATQDRKANSGRDRAGRGTAARSVIPQAIGQKSLNINQVSRGLVNDASANTSVRGSPGNGKNSGKGLNSASGAGNALGGLTVPLSTPIPYGSYGASRNNSFKGNAGGNRNVNGNWKVNVNGKGNAGGNGKGNTGKNGKGKGKGKN